MKKFLIVLCIFVFCWMNLSFAQSSKKIWIECNQTQLLNWQCKMQTYKLLGIRKTDQENTSVWLFVQDTIGGVTMFIGTIVVIAIIISGLLFVFSWANSSLKEKAQKWLVNAVIGLLIVFGSYSIIRLVQYLVKGR